MDAWKSVSKSFLAENRLPVIERCNNIITIEPSIRSISNISISSPIQTTQLLQKLTSEDMTEDTNIQTTIFTFLNGSGVILLIKDKRQSAAGTNKPSCTQKRSTRKMNELLDKVEKYQQIKFTLPTSHSVLIHTCYTRTPQSLPNLRKQTRLLHPG